MDKPNRIVPPGARRCRQVTLLALIAFATASFAASASASAGLPDTPAGKLGGELIRHVNTDTPEQIRQWAAAVLSPAMDQTDQADFVSSLVSAARDSGGMDLADVRSNPHQPGLLQLAVKTHRTGQWALFVVAADPAHAGKLAQASIFPMDDPALYAGWPKGAVSHAEMARLIRAALDRLVRTSDFSGCLTVSDGGKTVFDECRGLAERSFGVPIDHQTKFAVGSIGKMFTAVAIAQLVEAGKLSWDATLDQLVPEYPDHAAAKHITVWELLHHTAGLGDFLVPEFFRQREKYVNPVDYLSLIARQPRVGEPGKAWNYSNAGYMLLGRIIENVSRENYFDYVQQHVFAPAGMTASGFDGVEDITPKLAVGYFHEELFSSTWKAAWLKLGFKSGPAGGGYSTNADLLRFAGALHKGKLVKPATLARMFDGEVPAGPGGYAAGFGDRLSHGRHIRGHAGGIEGTDANLQMVWETGAAVALTSNEGPAQTWLLAEHIADLLAAEGVKP
ncbi:serine hydrolase domain-containing protein [Rhodanobacter lindaniclasticus]|jgi:CubicO group peptidase (beta-lactamase class C family)|uniref:serine hydrolase domain-containing protein n=1 Tax=Rhodanobacter lindaniclasticus TaxID=75310 RepID=UPI00109F2A53|nr:serine hydrolase domain-containing protein [Rhodanobacter lindaniclasticus]